MAKPSLPVTRSEVEWLPDWVAIAGSGYIGLAFRSLGTGCEVTMIEALD